MTVRVLVCVITGGRPRLKDRPSRKFLADLSTIADVEYVVREDQAEGYETDPNAPVLNTYSVDWADEFARTHWRHPRAVFNPGGFHGAFTGREWAMRTGEERGYDLVFQLDDNVQYVAPYSAPRAGVLPSTNIAKMAEAMIGVIMSTNLHMCGFQLSSVVPPKKAKLVRAGFPYSMFMEKTGQGRMPYYGPFEDDIMHAMEYGLNGGRGRTAGLIPGLTYKKESKSKTGMRSHYNHERGLELVRRYPQNAKLVVSNSTSSPTQVDGQKSVRHRVNSRGFTPIVVTDRDQFDQAAESIKAQVAETNDALADRAKQKMKRKAIKNG